MYRYVHALACAAVLALTAPFAGAETPPASPLADVTFEPANVGGKPGFFRVGKATNDRWYFVTPDDKAFYYRGVTSINRAGTAGGRRAKNGPYFDVVTAKYADPKAFATEQVRRLRSWGFNALGAWCEDTFFDLPVDGAVMPYTEITEFSYVGPSIKGDGIRLPDVYDPAWEKAIDAWAAKICGPRKNSKQLVGYFTDNELTWAQVNEEDIANQAEPDVVKRDKPRVVLLQFCLSLDEKAPAFQAAWAFAMKRHNNNLAAVSQAWGVKVTGKNSIRALNPGLVGIASGNGFAVGPAAGYTPARPAGGGAGRGPAVYPWQAISTAGFYEDQRAFSDEFAQRYFRLSAEAIRKHDPNHLILGCRFGGPPGKTVLAAMKKEWVDVCSANNYRPNMAERMDIYHQGSGLPVLNGEFSYHTGLFKMRGKTHEGMARIGADSLLKFFEHPACVGYTWYRWDQDDTPNPRDPAGMSCGIVNLQDRPVQIHVDTLKAVNAQADAIAAKRAGAK